MRDTEKAAQILNWIIQTSPDLVPTGSWARPAEKIEDLQQATDAVIVVPNGDDIPVGYREWRDGRYRAMHLRFMNEGQPTEFAKIKGGEAKWYLYAWHDGNRNLVTIQLIDLDRMRERGWFDTDNFAWRWPTWLNHNDDFTAMVGTMIHWLDDEGCILFRHWFEDLLYKKSNTLNDPAPDSAHLSSKIME